LCGRATEQTWVVDPGDRERDVIAIKTLDSHFFDGRRFAVLGENPQSELRPPEAARALCVPSNGKTRSLLAGLPGVTKEKRKFHRPESPEFGHPKCQIHVMISADEEAKPVTHD